MQASKLRIATRSLVAIFLLLLTGCSAARGLRLFPASQETARTEEATQPATQTDTDPTTTPWTMPAASPTPVPSPTLTLLSGKPSIGDPFTPDLGNTGYDVQHYDLQLAVNPSESHLSATVTVEAVTTTPNLRQISLDFIGFEISAVTVDDATASFERDADKLWVTFPQPLLDEGTPFALSVQYAGQPEQRDSPYIHYADYLGLIFPGSNQFYTLSEPDGARYWFPANDHPLDKATFHTELTVPRGLAAIANGQLVDSSLSTMPDGSDGATFVWEHNYPMATYLALAAGGHYLRVEEEAPNGIPLVYYYFPELEDEYLEAVEVTGEAMDWLSERFGPYPFDSYGQVSYYALGISMEMQTMTLLSFQMLDERTVVHELTHSWVGNWVGLDNWGDTWRKEGLATYMEVLWLSRDDPARLEELIAEIEQEVAEKGRDYDLNQPPRERILSFDSYQRGALLMHALHEEIGDEAFFEGWRSYIAEYGGGSAGQEEFEAAMEEAAGRSLQEFFERWLAPIESP
ncbi:MAG: M1 family metallopeptidase [Chloroflexota bacterium]